MTYAFLSLLDNHIACLTFSCTLRFRLGQESKQKGRVAERITMQVRNQETYNCCYTCLEGKKDCCLWLGLCKILNMVIEVREEHSNSSRKFRIKHTIIMKNVAKLYAKFVKGFQCIFIRFCLNISMFSMREEKQGERVQITIKLES